MTNELTPDTSAATTTELQTELTLILLKPITFAKEEVTELHLSEPTAGQLVAASKAGNQLEQLIELTSLNAKVLKGLVLQLGQRDIGAAASFFARFGEGPLQTSETSSQS